MKFKTNKVDRASRPSGLRDAGVGPAGQSQERGLVAMKRVIERLQTNQWTYTLISGGVVVGRLVHNGFNVLAYGAGDEHLGYWTGLREAQQAVERWLEINQGASFSSLADPPSQEPRPATLREKES